MSSLVSEENNSSVSNDFTSKRQNSKKGEQASSITKGSGAKHSIIIENCSNINDGFTDYGYVSSLKTKANRSYLKKVSVVENDPREHHNW